MLFVGRVLLVLFRDENTAMSAIEFWGTWEENVFTISYNL